jgi:hypothetical protein
MKRLFMKIEPEDFALLVRTALEDQTVTHMRPVIEKELLHYDILFCLDQSGLLDDLVFQGGTALRLCYGGSRFSEDLDFAGGSDFCQAQLDALENTIKTFIGKRYDLTVNIKGPKPISGNAPAMGEEPPRTQVAKWTISIITAPARKDLPQQRIKIEVAAIPAYTKTPQTLISNYKFLPDGYNDTLIYTETLDEKMADKMIALPATVKDIRYRDLWDLTWLSQQGAKLDTTLIRRKARDYGIVDYTELLKNRTETLPEIVSSGAFRDEMRRFLPTDVFDRTLGQSKFSAYLEATLTKLLDTTYKEFTGSENDLEDFKM